MPSPTDYQLCEKLDKLLILEKGEIVEQGTHDELLENNGLYRRLVDMQLSWRKSKEYSELKVEG